MHVRGGKEQKLKSEPSGFEGLEAVPIFELLGVTTDTNIACCAKQTIRSSKHSVDGSDGANFILLRHSNFSVLLRER